MESNPKQINLYCFIWFVYWEDQNISILEVNGRLTFYYSKTEGKSVKSVKERVLFHNGFGLYTEFSQ